MRLGTVMNHVQRFKMESLSIFNFTTKVFHTCWPLFAYKIIAKTGDISSRQKLVDGFLLVAWSVATTLRLQFEDAEAQMSHLAYWTSDNDQKRFARLVDFRCDLGKCYDDLRSSRELTGYYLMNSMARRPALPLNDMLFQQYEEMRKPLCAFLAELEKKLDVIKENLNEELQVTIGAVQVREAQLMREQAKVTARQTTWTVALTVLAAVYLPMTLVTGIFGMNITEISSEATAPNAWWAVGIWVVVVTLTVGGILLYVKISKLRARKRKADLEANNAGEIRYGKGKAQAGKSFVDTSKDRIRWLKQKAKMVWTRKQE